VIVMAAASAARERNDIFYIQVRWLRGHDRVSVETAIDRDPPDCVTDVDRTHRGTTL
jgi:hypothetical protein